MARSYITGRICAPTCFCEWAAAEPTPPLPYPSSEELVYNKAQRLTFDSSSPSGILLFRDASAIVVASQLV